MQLNWLQRPDWSIRGYACGQRVRRVYPYKTFDCCSPQVRYKTRNDHNVPRWTLENSSGDDHLGRTASDHWRRKNITPKSWGPFGVRNANVKLSQGIVQHYPGYP